ncbi:MAG: glycosyltransferase family 1 protein [Rhodothermales bacterium]|nr:glycosyltransferase family 1 protein [Rhodothermales bacterium]MBO6778861.1 glycosyltransferase family 1 protein [Rhodothermales bacterium]
MRVALFSGAYDHIADGVSLTLNRLVGHLEARGALVRVLAPTIEQPALEGAGELDPVPSIAMPGREEYRISRRLTADHIARLESFDPHLVHLATPDIPGAQALRWARSRGLPVVASYHTHFTSYLSYYRMGWLEGLLWRYLRNFYRRCDRVLVPSRSMADVLAEHGIQGNVGLWKRGVELDRFDPAHRDMSWRRDLGFADKDVVVTLVSRLVVEKGLDVFADTVQELTARGVPVRCLIVGEGPARAMLEESLPGAIFLGHQTGSDLSRAYASSDVFVFPSYTETFGNVTLEAMASGLPTVCADATGSRSLVKPGVTGFLAPPMDVARFTEHVERLVTDDELRNRMSQAARQEAATYAWPVILDGMVDEYLSVLRNQEAAVA